MSQPRIEAAHFSAQRLLRKAWQDRNAVAGDAPREIESVLLRAPEFIAKEYLGLEIQYLAFYPGNQDIAGFLERHQKLVGIVTSNPQTAQRFTLAHEIGHYMLHTSCLSFRDRSLSAPDASAGRPVEEREADAFAAEFLIPRKHLTRVFHQSFGEVQELHAFDPELKEAIPISAMKRISEDQWLRYSPLEKGRIFSRLRAFKGKIFPPLADRFNVSPTAVSIQLLQTGLLR